MISHPPAIEIFGIYDRGVPNQERIVLRVNSTIDLSEFFVFLGFRAPLNAELILPIPDQFLWLGQSIVNAPGWIFIYTGPGKSSVSQEVNTKEPVHNIYWNKSKVAFDHSDIVPALMHCDQLMIGNKPNKYISDLNDQKKIGLNNDNSVASILAALSSNNN